MQRSYGGLGWNKKVASIKLDHIQRLAGLHITSAVRTTPILAREINVGLRPLAIHIKQEAILSCYRIFVNGRWVQTYCGHTSIKHSLTAHAHQSQMRSDKTLPQYIFDKNYTVCIPSKDDCRNQTIDIPDDIICFTDGSRHLWTCQSGSSVFNQTLNQEHACLLTNTVESFKLKYMLS